MNGRSGRARPWPRRVHSHVALVAALLAACGGDVEPRTPPPDTGLLERMLAAEDARAANAAQAAPLVEGLVHPDAHVRRLAVRAFGRIERAEWIPTIAPLLADAEAAVRAEAVNALGQAARGGGVEDVRSRLLAHLTTETDPLVLGAVAETLGRLPHDSVASARSTSDALLDVLQRADGDAHAQLGVVRGYYFLARQAPARGALPLVAHAALRASLGAGIDAGSDSAAGPLHNRRIRTVAAAALLASGGAESADYQRILADPDPLVRREAAAALAGLRDPSRDALLPRALADASAMVRYDALRSLARIAGAAACGAIVDAFDDAGPHVRLLAIDLAGSQCDGQLVADPLNTLAAALPAADTGWHAAAHALVSLAAVDTTRARQRLPDFVAHSNFFVRAYAANAATVLDDVETLSRLAADAHPNVRTAAVAGLAATAGHAADSIYIAQLDQTDSQLLQSAAAALAGSTDPAAPAALAAALERSTARRRETERDARMALLERLAEVGDAETAAALEPYTRDFDPAVAARAADAIEVWTGVRPQVAPAPLPRLPLPSYAALDSLANARVVLVMASGDTVEIALRPFDAPTNTYRFARLVREGAFDGRTLHRVAPNFVVQGGSPNANEYSGEGPFSRDELVWQANWRGTVGLSTRGRDTGDAQIYINLIDNVRLDHDYTVFGEVVRGMDAVDALLEGAAIARATLR